MPVLDGKIILITGAGRGGGRELALALAVHGATLALNDISPINVDETAAKISSTTGQARVYLHDVAKKVAVQSLVNQVCDDFGRIDLLINNARVEHPDGLLEMDEWDLRRVFDVNAIGAFLAMQAVSRVMRAQGGGVILNLLGDTARRLSPACAASRRAAEELTRAAAVELSADGIRVFGLARGIRSEPNFASLEQAALAFLFSDTLPPGEIFGARA